MKSAAKLIVAVLLAAAAGWAQQAGPMQAPSEPPVIHRIPLYAKVPPPPMAPEQIVQRFTVNETKYKEAYQTYGFRQTIRVEELNSQGDPTGSYQVQAEVYVKPGRGRYERILNWSKSSLQYLALSSQDLETIAEIPPFPLAGQAAGDYHFTYRGTEKQGELMTYAFQVEPKSVQPGHVYFSGVVWVDTVDLAIVKSYGHFVTSGPKAPSALPFSFYETYRENVAGKYWFPSYLRSDDYYHQGKNELPIRLIVQSSAFHPGKPGIPPAKARR
ncbi:MAG TPA: hypothetical protein VNJ52_11445 [Patescibacteria group bacterium]|nr:hypothetical protein [Patescibacteria group bacterium]